MGERNQIDKEVEAKHKHGVFQFQYQYRRLEWSVDIEI